MVPLLVAYKIQPASHPHPSSPCSALAAAFLLHYTYRSLMYYPLRLRGAKGTALVVWAMAFTFCCWNGFIQVTCSSADWALQWCWYYIERKPPVPRRI